MGDYLLSAAHSSIPDYLVVLLGFGTVFVGLVCIVLMIELMHLIVSKASKPEQAETKAVPTAAQPIENRQEIIAAVAAVLAEELGTDVSAIRIHSFKKIN